jgi:hypothetical protein
LKFFLANNRNFLKNPKDSYDKFQNYSKVTKAIIETNQGKIVFSLLPDIAPETVRNFIKLAKTGFYDGTLFHRVRWRSQYQAT